MRCIYVTSIVSLWQEFRYIGLKRIEHFHSSKPQPHQFTILVRNVPSSDGSSVSDTVDNFFRENHSSTYMSHVVIRRTSKLRSIVVSPWNSSIGPITTLSLGWSSFSKSGSCRIMLKSCIKRWNRRSQNIAKLERRQWDSSVARTLLRVTMRECYRNWNITYDWDKLKFHHLEKYASDSFFGFPNQDNSSLA